MRRHKRTDRRRLISSALANLDEDRRIEAAEVEAENAQIREDMAHMFDILREEELSEEELSEEREANFAHDPYDFMEYDRHEEEDERRFYGDAPGFADW
jgi:hypothetical protein